MGKSTGKLDHAKKMTVRLSFVMQLRESLLAMRLHIKELPKFRYPIEKRYWDEVYDGLSLADAAAIPIERKLLEDGAEVMTAPGNVLPIVVFNGEIVASRCFQGYDLKAILCQRSAEGGAIELSYFVNGDAHGAVSPVDLFHAFELFNSFLFRGPAAVGIEV